MRTSKPSCRLAGSAAGLASYSVCDFHEEIYVCVKGGRGSVYYLNVSCTVRVLSTDSDYYVAVAIFMTREPILLA